ncbi:MAG: enoyl-CoA hydratase [Pseudomonadota bacterium]
MYSNNFADRILAAAFSVVISAGLFAYAIIPASPAIA